MNTIETRQVDLKVSRINETRPEATSLRIDTERPPGAIALRRVEIRFSLLADHHANWLPPSIHILGLTEDAVKEEPLERLDLVRYVWNGHLPLVRDGDQGDMERMPTIVLENVGGALAGQFERILLDYEYPAKSGTEPEKKVELVD